MANRAKEREDKFESFREELKAKNGGKEETKPSSTPTTGTTTTFTPGATMDVKDAKRRQNFDSYRAELNARNNNSASVDDAYINTFLEDAHSFLSRSSNSLKNMDWRSATSVDRTAWNNEYDALRGKEEKIRAYLRDNKDTIDSSAYDQITSLLDNFHWTSIDAKLGFRNANKYYSQWDTEEKYNWWNQYNGKSYDELSAILGNMEEGEEKTWLTDYAAYVDNTEKLGYDLDAGAKELDRLKNTVDSFSLYTEEIDSLIRWYNEYQVNPGAATYGMTNSEVQEKLAMYKAFKNRFGSYDAMMSELRNKEDLLKNKTEYLAEAKRLQEADRLAQVSNPNAENYDPEFANYKGYVSTVKGEGWTETYDMEYEYINAPYGGAKSRKEIYSEYSDGNDLEGTQWLLDKTSDYEAMTRDEVAIYNYYYNKFGKEAAKQYLNSIQYTLNVRQGKEVALSMEDNTLLELAFSISAGLDQFSSGMQGVVNAAMGNDEYVAPSATQFASGMVREDLADDSVPLWYNFKTGKWEYKVLGRSLGQAAYDLGVTTSNMVPSILASSAISMFSRTAGAIVGKALMGASAAGNAYTEKINLGYTHEEATTYGLAVGASEVLLESILGGIEKLGGGLLTNTLLKNLDAVDNVLARFAKSAGGKVLLNASSEAIEEGLQSVIEPYLWQAVSGGNVSVDWQETFYSALMGFATGGLFEGVEVGPAAVGKAIDTFKQNTATGRDIMDLDGGVNSLMTIGDDMANLTTGRDQQNLMRQIEKVSAKMDAGSTSNRTARKVAKLYDMVKGSLSTQNHADIVKALTKGENSFSSKDANKIAGALVAMSNGLELTEAQIDLLDSVKSNPAVLGIVESINSNETLIGQRNQQLRQFVHDVNVNANVKAITKAVTEKEFTPEGIYETSSGNKAIRTDTNEEIDIKRVKEIGRGKLVLELADGSEIDAKSVSFANEADALIYEAVGKLGENIDAERATQLIKQFKGGDAMVFARGIAQAYTYGFYGIDKSELFSKHSLADKLTEEQREFAYNLGKEYRPTADKIAKDRAGEKMAKTGKTPGEKGVYFRDKDGNATDIDTYLKKDNRHLNDRQKSGIEMMKKMSEMMGIRFNVFETWVESGEKYYLDENGVKTKGDPNGFYDTVTGEIYIDLNAGSDYSGTMVFTIAHEVTHFMRQWSPEHFRKIAEIVYQHGEMKGSVSELAALKMENAKRKGKPISYDVAMEEVVADGMETILKNGKVVQFMADVKQKDHSGWQKLKGWFMKLAKFLRSYIGKHANTVEGRKVSEFSKDLLSQIEQIYAEGAVASGENYQTALRNVVEAEVQKNTTEEGGVKQQSRMTETDIKAVQGIGRISVNQFSAADIKATERFARQYWKEMGVKSPFFRAWFGDWRINDQTKVQIANKKGDTRGVQKNADTGWNVQVSGQIFAESKHFAKKNKSAMPYLPYINDIVEKAILLDSYGIEIGKAKSQNSLLMHSLYAVADVGHGPELLKLYVEEMNDPNSVDTSKRAYQLQNIEKASAVNGGVQGNSPSSLANTTNAIRTVSDLFASVKMGDSSFKPKPASKVVNPDGTPKEVYHGTVYDFTIFDGGAFFTDDYFNADGYASGEIVLETFLKIERPLIIDAQGHKWNELTTPYGSSTQQIIHNTDRSKYDGVIFENINDSWTDDAEFGNAETVYYPFKNSQIKSATDNVGTFDGSNPDIRYSDRDSAKTRTFKNGQNAKGEFIANVLIDLADSNSEWWTGRYNRGILGMSKNDDTEFRQFYQEILKRTKEMDEYEESDNQIVEDSFTVQDGKGRKYVYVVKLDGYLHGVVLGKIDAAKHERAMKRYERSKEYGRPDADISRRTANARNEVERHSSRNSRYLTSDGDSGYGRVDSGSPQGDLAGNDEGESPPNRKVPTVTDSDGALHQDRTDDSVSNRTKPVASDLSRYRYSDRDTIKYADRDFTYKELVAKKDMQGRIIGRSQTVKLTSNGSIDRAWVVAEVMKQCKSIQTKAPLPTYYVNIPDIGKNVEITSKPIEHGFIKYEAKKGNPVPPRSMINARASLDLPHILQNSIEVNRSDRGDNSEVEFSHVLIGVTAMESANGTIEYYAVRSVVEARKNQGAILTEANVIGKLHAMNAKKIGKPHAQVGGNNTALTSSSLFAYSVADLLNDVKTDFADTFSNDVYKHFGMKREYNEYFSKHLLFSDRDSDSVSNRSLLANALEAVAKTDIERAKLQEYKDRIALLDEQEKKLRDLNAQIKELSFAKGPRDTKKISALRDEATKTANRISNHDKKLLQMESAAPLQNVLAREKKKAYKRAEQKGREALKEYRAKVETEQKETAEKWRASRKKAVEGRAKTAVRHKIQHVVGELNQLLLNEDKKRHVPDNLKKAVAEALALVNMDTVGAEERIAKYEALITKESDPDKIDAYTVTLENIKQQGEKMGQRLKELRDAYEEIANSADPDIAGGYDPVIAGNLKELSESVGNTALKDMSIEQLEDVYSMYRMVLTRVRDANKSLIDSIKESISERASRVADEVRAVGGDRKHRVSILDPVRRFLWNNLKPVYAMEHIGSSTMTEAFNNVRKGEDIWAKDVTEARAYYLDKSKKYGYDSWDFEKKYSFASTSGIKFELTLEQIMSIYAYSKRDQALDHLRLGGFVFDSNIETTKDRGGKKGLLKYKVNTADAHQISADILADIVDSLSKEQRGFVDEMQDYLSTTMGAKGNEVTMKMYGVKLFKEKFYFPLKSAKQFMFEQNEVSGEVKIKNSGFTNKAKPNANNPVILNNFMDVWADHVNDMSMYHSFVLPLEDFNRIFNYESGRKEGTTPVSVKGAIQSAYSPAAVSYVKQLITDLNGGAMSDPRETFAKSMLSRFKKAKVFSSLSVVIQQPSSIGRAFALVDPKYFQPTKDGMNHDELWEELKQYAPIAIIKEMGYFDTNMGKSTQDFIKAKEYSGFRDKAAAFFIDSDYRDETLSKAPALADELTWCAIWNAVKRETIAKHKDLRPGSEELLKAAGERFTEVVSKTQVYDSVLARSANMRSKSGLMSMVTSFMAEPTTSINMLEDALRKSKRGYKGYASRVFASVAVSVILNNALVALVYGMRDDDEDETFAEKYVQAFVSGMLDDVNPLTYLPFLKDMWSVLQGYDVERSDMSLVSDLADALEGLVKAYASEDGDVAEAWLDIAGAVANIGGVPMQNIRREIEGAINFVNTIIGDANGRATTLGSMGDALEASVKDSLPVIGWLPGETKGDKLYDAIISGDTAYVDRLRGSYETEAAYHSAVRKALRENDPRIKEAATAQFNGDPSERVRIQKLIIADGFSQDDVVAATNAEINAMKPDEGSSSTKAKGFYTAEDFAMEIANGDHASAYAVKVDIIQTAQKNGKSAEDAEKSFISSAKTELKELYLAGKLSRDKAVNALTTYCGVKREDAVGDVQYWDFKRNYPEAFADEAWIDEYYEEVESSGISLKVFVDYRNKVKGITGDGKKEKRMAVIHSLPITSEQKDALYLAEGWAATKLYEAPWN